MKHFLIFAIKDICYSSYLYFAHALTKALRQAGHCVELFTPKRDLLQELESLSGRTFDAIFDFNSDLPRLTMEEGGFFLDQIHAPFYDIILDHPLYHHDSLKQKLSDFHVLCLDENHKKYIKAWYPHIASADVFPMTGEDTSPSDLSYPAKTIDLLFAGTYTNYQELESSIAACPSFLEDLTKKLIHRMMDDTSLTQEAALSALLPSLDEAELIEETFPLHMQACFLCDSYLRAFKREQLLCHLAKEKLPLTLCGNGWHKSPLADFPQVIILDNISFQDTFSLFRRSKITLNLLPEFKNGTHDRIYSAMLNHSLCLTDSSPRLAAEFKDGKDICFYHTQYPENLTNCIFQLLSSPDTLMELSQNGYFRAKENHSWQSRAACLLKLL